MMQTQVLTTGPAPAQGIQALEAFLLPRKLEGSARQWYETAVDQEMISLVDCQTIRDLLAMAGIEAPEAGLHALLIALFAARRQGSLCLPLAEESLAKAFKGFAGDQAGELAKQAKLTLAADAMPTLLGHPGSSAQPLIVDAGNLYFQKYHLHERRLASKLKSLCQSESMAIDDSLMQAVEEVAQYKQFTLNARQKLGVYMACRNRFAIISGGPGTGKTTLVVALIRALARQEKLVPARVCLIAPTGRAGQRLGESLRTSLDQANPGQGEDLAAWRDLEGSTIHRVLKYNPSRHAFTHNAAHRLPYDLVVCDEVSMVDVMLMDRLLAAVRDDARVVFLGDKDQLPSVEAGAVLGDLVPRQCTPAYSATVRARLPNLVPVEAPVSSGGMLTDRVVLLNESHRAKGKVWDFAKAANQGETEAAAQLTGCPIEVRQLTFHSSRQASLAANPIAQIDWSQAAAESCNLLDPGPQAATRLKDLALSWTSNFLARKTTGEDESYQALVAASLPNTALSADLDENDVARLAKAFEKLAAAQILTVVRRGPFGCESLNRHLVKSWKPHFDARAGATSAAFAGLPIMATRNDHFHQLYNGEVGIVQRLDGADRHVAVFRRGRKKFLILPVERLPAWEAAFAITVHKSQGSEYGNVLLVLPDATGHPLLTREILYTGATRSKNKVFIFAAMEALKAAIACRIERVSGLDMWQDETM